MKLTGFSRTFLVASALLFSIVTCMGQDKPSDQLEGTWIKSVNGGTVTFTISPEQKWEVEFTGGDEADVYGTYVISGTQITFTDKGGVYSSDASGTYEFKVDDPSLTFTKVNDPVDGRSMLVAGNWAKAGEAEK